MDELAIHQAYKWLWRIVFIIGAAWVAFNIWGCRGKEIFNP